MLLGSPSLPESMVPSANHPWQPQPPVQLLEDLSEAHAKPSVVPQSTTQGFGCNTNNPFWLRSAGPQPPVFSFPPSSSAPATSRENIFSNTASYRAPDTSFTVSIPQRSLVREALHRSVHTCGSYWLFLLEAARRKFTQLSSLPFSTSSVTKWSMHFCRYH
jgi:hypothetical protein